MTRKERLAGLRKAMRKLNKHEKEFSCLAVCAGTSWREENRYAAAMGDISPNGYSRNIEVSDIIGIFPKYRLGGSTESKVFAKVMDFRVWLVAMYYGYVASGAQEEAESVWG